MILKPERVYSPMAAGLSVSTLSTMNACITRLAGGCAESGNQGLTKAMSLFAWGNTDIGQFDLTGAEQVCL